MRLNTEVDRPTLLDELDIAASVPEASFDRIVTLAADLFDAPIALVTLFDAEHQWLKAKVGVDLTKMPRSESFCTHTILSDDVMVVPDARLDHRFRDLPLVDDPQGVRFYAGAPLKAEDGCRIGAVCVLDRRPRVDFSDRDRGRLTVLARMAMGEIEQRRRRRVAAIAKDFVDRTDDIFVCTHVDGRIVYVNQAVERLFGYGAAEMTGQDIAMIIPERFREMRLAEFAHVVEAARFQQRGVEVSRGGDMGEKFRHRRDASRPLAALCQQAAHHCEEVIHVAEEQVVLVAIVLVKRGPADARRGRALPAR